MGYDLYWNEKQVEQDARRYRQVRGLRREVEKQLEAVQKQIRWYSEPARVKKRFHNAFTLGGLKIGEIRFGRHGKTFRILCVLIHDEGAAVYYQVVDKSNQNRKLRLMRENAEEIERSIREEFL